MKHVRFGNEVPFFSAQYLIQTTGGAKMPSFTESWFWTTLFLFLCFVSVIEAVICLGADLYPPQILLNWVNWYITHKLLSDRIEYIDAF